MQEAPLPNHKRQAGESALVALGALTEENASSLDQLSADAGEEKTTWHPLTTRLQPTENTHLLELITTENKIVNKIVIVFTSLCQEVQELDKEFREYFVDELVLFAEGSSETAVQDGDHLVIISQFLPKLCDLQEFVKRCQQVFQHLVNHLGAFYNGAYSKSKTTSCVESHLTDVMEHMGSLLLILVTIDTIIAKHETFTVFWSAYLNALDSNTVHTSNKFDNTKLALLREMCTDIGKTVCSGRVFLDAVAPFEDSKITEKYSRFFQEFDKYIKNCLNTIDAEMKEQLISPNMGDSWGRTAVLIAANLKMNNVYSAPWKSVPIKNIISWNPIVTLYNFVPWNPAAFIVKHEAKNDLLNLLSTNFLEQVQSVYITRTTKYLEDHLPYLTFQVFNWILDMEIEHCANRTRMDNEELTKVPTVHSFGLNYAKKLKGVVTSLVFLYTEMGKPVAQTTVLHIFRLVELIKGIQVTFHRHQSAIANNIHHVLQSTSASILLTIKNLKAKVVKSKKKYKAVDVLSALIIAEKCLDGAITPTRLLVARIALSLANQDGLFNKNDISNLKRNLRLLTKVIYLGWNIENDTNCKFLNLSSSILPTYFSSLLSEKTHLDRIQYVLASLFDGAKTPAELKRSFEHSRDLLAEKVINPLSSAIEENLRLHSHAYSEGYSEEFQKHALSYDKKELVNTADLFFPNIDSSTAYSLGDSVENRLNNLWYTLTALSPRDWQKYKEMRTLLAHKYHLNTIDDHLPRQTRHVKDVLEIMREIPSFVKSYKYNLNNQMFVELHSSSKFLYVITLDQITNSFETHGTGFLNTTVNYVFQFLLAKVKVVSQFLFDEKIKSKLLKDLSYFKTNEERLDSKYPYKRALSFNDNVRKLGLVEDNSFLDLFRITITEIGNAIGYIRLLKSGAQHYIYNNVSYIPESKIDSFEDRARTQNLSDTTISTASLLDQVVHNVMDSGTGTLDYIQMFVKHVAPALRDPENHHLRHFCMIVPPLIVNYCDSIISAKDKLEKGSTEGAYFTDDGFAMGVAFLLSAIGVNIEFDSLHFFDSIEKHFDEIREFIKNTKRVSQGDTKLEQTLSLKETLCTTLKNEHDLLFYSLSSARVFFRNELRAPVVKSNASNLPRHARPAHHTQCTHHRHD